MYDSTGKFIYALTAIVCCLVLSAAIIIGPVERPAATYGMQLTSGASAGDGESCPRSPDGEAASQAPILIPVKVPAPVQPAIFIEVLVPANQSTERGLIIV